MGFSVNQSALPGLVTLLDRRWRSLAGGRPYLADHATIDARGRGLLNLCWGAHERNVAAVDGFLATMADRRVGPFAAAITRADQYYARTDLAAAAALDNTYPGIADTRERQARAGQHADLTAGAEVFTDPVHPGSRYLEIEDYRAEYHLEMYLSDGLSPTSVYRDVVWYVTSIASDLGLLDHPVDFVEEYCTQFSGDWAAFAGCADVFANIGGEMADNALSVAAGGSALTRVWTGNAADACQIGLFRLAHDLDLAPGVLRRLAGRYRHAAEKIKMLSETLSALTVAIIDEAVDIALDACTDGAAELLIDVNLTRDLARLVEKIWEARSLIRGAIDVVRDFINGSGADLGDLGIIPGIEVLPTGTGGVPRLPRLLGAPS